MSHSSVPGAKHTLRFETNLGPQSNFRHPPVSFSTQTDLCYKTASNSKGWLYVEVTVDRKNAGASSGER
jgi:hypothetical protein